MPRKLNTPLYWSPYTVHTPSCSFSAQNEKFLPSDPICDKPLPYLVPVPRPGGHRAELLEDEEPEPGAQGETGQAQGHTGHAGRGQRQTDKGRGEPNWVR